MVRQVHGQGGALSQRWTIDCPDNQEVFPWVLRDNGVIVQRFASYGSAYHAMMARLESKVS
jgi:hypothetical protein